MFGNIPTIVEMKRRQNSTLLELELAHIAMKDAMEEFLELVGYAKKIRLFFRSVVNRVER